MGWVVVYWWKKKTPVWINPKAIHKITDNHCTSTITLHTEQAQKQQHEQYMAGQGIFARPPSNPIRKKKNSEYMLTQKITNLKIRGKKLRYLCTFIRL